MTVASKAAGYNLVPVFELWGHPIEQSTKDKLQHLQAFLPDDFFTKLAPDAVKKIVEKYPGIARSATKIEDIWMEEISTFSDIMPNDVQYL